MTGFVVRHRTGRFWTGIPDDWSPRQEDAKPFNTESGAAIAVYLHCGTDPEDFTVEPVYVEPATEAAA